MNAKEYDEFRMKDNYLALLDAIVKGEVKNLARLFDYEEAEKRLKELDEIYARGELPPLAKEFKKYKHNTKKEVKRKSQKGKKVKVRLYDTLTEEHFEFNSKSECSRWITGTEGWQSIKNLSVAISAERLFKDRYYIEEI